MRLPSVGMRLLLSLCAVLWLGGIAAGFSLLAEHQSTAGTGAAAPSQWPAGTGLERAPDRPTLLLFAHPRCPCTRATLEELNRLLARCGHRLHTLVLCYADETLGSDWARTDVWTGAESLPGVTVHEDPRGALAQAFGAQTSGQVLLYGADGALRFAGGITPSRGHAGDSAGAAAVLAHVLGQGGADAACVYGCGLLNGGEAAP